MNYNSVILVSILVLTTIWWFVFASKHYPGPKLSNLYVDGEIVELPRDVDEKSE